MYSPWGAGPDRAAAASRRSAGFPDGPVEPVGGSAEPPGRGLDDGDDISVAEGAADDPGGETVNVDLRFDRVDPLGA